MAVAVVIFVLPNLEILFMADLDQTLSKLRVTKHGSPLPLWTILASSNIKCGFFPQTSRRTTSTSSTLRDGPTAFSTQIALIHLIKSESSLECYENNFEVLSRNVGIIAASRMARAGRRSTWRRRRASSPSSGRSSATAPVSTQGG